MRIAVTSTHTPAYAQLAEVTTPNHLKYCERQGYDYLSMRGDHLGWPYVLPADLGKLAEITKFYDAVLKIETDIVFTNLNISVEKLIQPTDRIVIAREPAGRAVLNVGSMIFCDSLGEASELLWKIANDCDKWIERSDDCYWQNYLGRLYTSNESVRSLIRLVDPRVLNSTDQTGDAEWTWQPGDFVCHCGGGLVDTRISRCLEMMRRARV